MNSLLTVGMAAYADPDGMYFTVQALRAYHPHVELLVVDTTPHYDGGHTRAVVHAARGTYYHRPDLRGTAAPRDAVIRLARTPWVMVVDSHVLLEFGAIQAAIEYAAKNPDSRDIIQGPLIHDDGIGRSTHWRPTHPPGLWGVWDRDERIKEGEPFDIPGQGLGQFLVRAAAWPGFHPRHRGFGGEEGYIHAKIRRRGGRSLCHPAMGWRHRFRIAAPPYPLALGDHVHNLLVGHRELGIDATAAIRSDLAKPMSEPQWAAAQAEAEAEQPFGMELPPSPRMRLIGVWYSNNAAPAELLTDSLASIRAAQTSSVRHDVRVGSCSWQAIPGNPLPWIAADVEGTGGHAAIARQIEQAYLTVAGADYIGEPDPYDAVVFLEHDVLYPPDYFDRIGDALARHPDAPVACNHDYIGLNASGWLAVRERHEPLHQIALRESVFERELQRWRDELKQGQILLEPDSGPDADRSKWVRIAPDPHGTTVKMPAVHVNHQNRFTNHGEVVYEATSTIGRTHPFWGDAGRWWRPHYAPAAVPLPTASTKPDGGCGCSGNAAPKFAIPAEWLHYVTAIEPAADSWEHLPYVAELAMGCGAAVELNHWGTPWLAALFAANVAEIVSVGPGEMPNWHHARRLRPDSGFTAIRGETEAVEIPECDVLLTDTAHTAEKLYRELLAHAGRVRRYIVIHDTDIYGERGDDGGPGLLPGLRRWLSEGAANEWVIKTHRRNNYGLTVLSRLPEDRKPLPPIAEQAKNFGKAAFRDLWNAAKVAVTGQGERRLPLAMAEARLAHCWTCEQRSGGQCSMCGCYLAERPDGGPGKAFWPAETCPLGKWTPASADRLEPVPGGDS